jgi:hypothetical protein
MRKNILLAGIMAVCLFSQVFGFATLTVGDGDSILFTTNVPGITVYKNGLPLTNISGTEQSLKLKREKGDVVLIFRKEGYKDQALLLQRSTTGTFWLNFIVGAIWGASSDLGTTGTASSSTDSVFTGNSLEYSPNQYYIELVKA